MPRVATSDGVPLLIQPGFLDCRTCEEIRVAMDRGVEEAAAIIDQQIETRPAVRHARSVEIEASLLHAVERRLDAVRPAVERAAGRPLGGREGTGFLRYPAGGFYLPHRDRGDLPGWVAAAVRSVSVVIFLNGETSGRRDFDGGLLCLYPEAPRRPVEIRPETGLLVAFPATILHEVLPVHGGTRDAAVDWFYDL